MDPANADAPEHPVGPSLEEWARMSRAERDAFIEAVNASHSDPLDAMSEGRPHKRATQGAADALSLHFAKLGRAVYVADELAVVYPGQESLVPDILAVVGVGQPADDERQAWVVADEGRDVEKPVTRPSWRPGQLDASDSGRAQSAQALPIAHSWRTPVDEGPPRHVLPAT